MSDISSRSAREVWTSSFPRTERSMYGKSPVEFPRRIVCLTAETTEIAFMVGAGDRVVGVPGTARRPEAARDRARVGGFTTFRTDRILALEPDLVLGFSDLQADVVAELIGAGVAVLCTNQRRLDEVLAAILLIGGALGCEAAARDVVADMRDRRAARERVVTAADVAARDPEIILASWCGKPVDGAAITARPGWDKIAAVASGEVHEIAGEDVLSPGPSLAQGLRRIHEIIQRFQAR